MAKRKADGEQITRYADMFAAVGTESRLRIMQLLLTAHPAGLVVGDIGSELDIPSSLHSRTTWKSSRMRDWFVFGATARFFGIPRIQDTLQELLGFLYAEYCMRGIRPSSLNGSSAANRRTYGREH